MLIHSHTHTLRWLRQGHIFRQGLFLHFSLFYLVLSFSIKLCSVLFTVKGSEESRLWKEEFPDEYISQIQPSLKGILSIQCISMQLLMKMCPWLSKLLFLSFFFISFSDDLKYSQGRECIALASSALRRSCSYTTVSITLYKGEWLIRNQSGMT